MTKEILKWKFRRLRKTSKHMQQQESHQKKNPKNARKSKGMAAQTENN